MSSVIKYFGMGLACLGFLPALAAEPATITINPAPAAAALGSGYTLKNSSGAPQVLAPGASTILLTAPVQAVSAASNDLNIQLDPAFGLAWQKVLSPTISLSNFSFNTGTNNLSMDFALKGGAINANVLMRNEPVLHAGTVRFHEERCIAGSMPGCMGTPVEGTPYLSRQYVVASDFSLSSAFIDDVAQRYGSDANGMTYLAQTFVQISMPVPEPSTFTLAGLGFLALVAVMRRRPGA